jgi:hypothetical protein
MMTVMSVLAEVAVIVPAVLGSAAVGAVLSAVSQSAAAQRAERRANRDRVRDLLSQIVNTVGGTWVQRLTERGYSDVFLAERRTAVGVASYLASKASG